MHDKICFFVMSYILCLMSTIDRTACTKSVILTTHNSSKLVDGGDLNLFFQWIIPIYQTIVNHLSTMYASYTTVVLTKYLHNSSQNMSFCVWQTMTLLACLTETWICMLLLPLKLNLSVLKLPILFQHTRQYTSWHWSYFVLDKETDCDDGTHSNKDLLQTEWVLLFHYVRTEKQVQTWKYNIPRVCQSFIMWLLIQFCFCFSHVTYTTKTKGLSS